MDKRRTLAGALVLAAMALFIYLLFGAASDAQGGIGLLLFLPVLIALLFAAMRRAKESESLQKAIRYGAIAPIAIFYFCVVGQAIFKPLGYISNGYISTVDRVYELFTGLTPYESSRGTSRLHKAALYNNVALIEKELKRGIFVDPVDRQQKTPLILCAEASLAQEACKLLLRSGANPNYQTPSGETPLLAAISSHPDTVRLLVEAGADVNAADRKGHTPLWHLNARIKRALSERRQDIADYLKPTADYLISKGARDL